MKKYTERNIADNKEAYFKNCRSRKNIILMASLVIILIISMLLGVCFGSTGFSLKEFVSAIISGEGDSPEYRIFFYVRLPRVLAALFSGMALAVSGVIIQGILNNPLAGPNIIGVNSGAGLGAMLAIAVLPSESVSVPFAAFVGALITTLLIFTIARKTGAGKVTIVLAGVAVSSIMSAGIDTIKTVFPDSAIDGNSFLIGGFSGVSMDKLFPAVYYIVIGLVFTLLFAKSIDIMGLGDETAQILGMNLKLMRFIMIVCASVLAGAAVSFSGLLGFVGLIIPHIIRRFTGNSHRILIPCAALAGGSFVILCDLLSRVIFAPYEIPVGIIMSFIGGPFFIVLLVTKRYKNI